jgi:hypothetical protein
VPALKLLHGVVGVYLTDGRVVHSKQELRAALGAAAAAAEAGQAELGRAAAREPAEVEDATHQKGLAPAEAAGGRQSLAAGQRQLAALPHEQPRAGSLDLAALFRSCMPPLPLPSAPPPTGGGSPRRRLPAASGTRSGTSSAESSDSEREASGSGGGGNRHGDGAAAHAVELLRHSFPAEDEHLLHAALAVSPTRYLLSHPDDRARTERLVGAGI